MNKGDATAEYPPTSGKDGRHRTAVLLPDGNVDECWAAIGTTSEYQVARAIIRLVAATGVELPGDQPLSVVVTLPSEDIAVLAPQLGPVADRLAGIVAAKVSGCRVRIELHAGNGGWSVSLGSAKRVLPTTRAFTSIDERTTPAVDHSVRTVRLCLVIGPGHRRIVVPDNGIVLGRAQSGDGFIRDTNVSREHCRVDIGAGFLVVEDLYSRNGTWVSGTRITVPTLLGLDDQLRLGRTELRVSPLDAGRP
jgi:hypothetical protein